MKGWRGIIYGILAVILAQGMVLLAAASPGLVELLYSRLLYRSISLLVARLTGIVPFSLAEMIIVSLIVVGAGLLIYWLCCGWRRPALVLSQVRFLLTVALFAYAGFMLLWGINYHRQPLAHTLGLEIQPASVEELTNLCVELMAQTNQLRALVAEDPQQVMALTGGKWRALARAELGYQQLADRLPLIGGRYGAPKGVYLSDWWSYTGIAGMYFPFTGEANVNMSMPDANIPAVACHEMAHQRGFAREDEANYLSYLACSAHPDLEFQYSGALMALTHSMRALYANDQEAYRKLRDQYDAGVVRDIKANQEFWQSYAGPVEKLSERMNDAYLKSNRQADGVQSYGRMVDLLLAARRARMQSSGSVETLVR